MKKLLLTIVAVLGIALTAGAQTDVAAIVGDYTGDLYVALGEEKYDADSKMPDPVKVNIKAGAQAGTVDFTLPNFGFMGLVLGDISLPGIGVKADGAQYKFADNKPVEFSFVGGAIKASASLNATKSYVKGDSVVAYIPVFWHNDGTETPIYVLFKGKKAVTTVDVKPILGDYAGDLYVALGEEKYDADSKMPDPVKVNLKAGAQAGTVDFTLPNFGFMGLVLGDISLPGIGVVADGANYKFADNKPVEFSFVGGAIKASASLNADKSYVKGDSLVAYIPVFWHNDGTETPIYVLFKGKKETATGIATAPTVAGSVPGGIYTISGIRVSTDDRNALPAGVYIIDGKKTIVR